VEKDHLRNRTPHFLCGSLTEEESTIAINTPVPNTPFPLKKSLNKSVDTSAVSLREFSLGPRQVKKASDKMAKNPSTDAQTSGMFWQLYYRMHFVSRTFSLSAKIQHFANLFAAVCYGDDPDAESGPEEADPKSEKKTNKNRSKKKSADDLALVYRDEEPLKTHGKEDKKVEDRTIEVFPPKAVAMHRVRWNMNTGSERWLCYGGAAGLVRCQEIILSDFDKKLAMKR
jgi:general transcription factor 3C polypeptide 2